MTKLDVPNKQVMIDSRVVIASDDFARDIGVRFGVTGVGVDGNNVGAVSGSLGGTNTIIGSAANNLKETGQPYPVTIPGLAERIGVNFPANPALGTPARLALSILGADYLVDLELSALQSEGKGEILSNPRIVTEDGQEASVKQGFEVPYTTPATANNPATVEFKEALLSLTVKPRIAPDDRVIMDLKINKDEPNFALSVQGNPPLQKREIKTLVAVNNGETVVLGGVFEQTKSNKQDKVPLLGDIPLLGYLFQGNTKGSTKRELLIFVTPQILKNGAVAER